MSARSCEWLHPELLLYSSDCRLREAEFAVEPARDVVVLSYLKRHPAAFQFTRRRLYLFKNRPANAAPAHRRSHGNVVDIEERACIECRESKEADGEADRGGTMVGDENVTRRMRAQAGNEITPDFRRHRNAALHWVAHI